MYQFRKLTAWPRVQFLLGFICGCPITMISLSLHDKNIPSAAVLSVPKGRFLPETGSQTSISPSSIMLKNCSFCCPIKKKRGKPLNSLVEGRVDVWCEAASPNVTTV